MIELAKMSVLPNSVNQTLMIFLTIFLKKSPDNVWSVCKKYLPLHPQSRGTPLESAEERVL